MATEGYIKYRSGYKHQLAFAYSAVIPIRPGNDIDTEFIKLGAGGELEVKQGYAWDGTSGPVVDTPQNMRASLVHDALYQLMRHGELNSRTHRKAADQLFRDMCIQDGVPTREADLFFTALRKAGAKAASPISKKKINRAPADKSRPQKKNSTTPVRKGNTTRTRKRKR